MLECGECIDANRLLVVESRKHRVGGMIVDLELVLNYCQLDHGGVDGPSCMISLL